MDVVASTDCELLTDASAAGRQSDSTSRDMNNFVFDSPRQAMMPQEYKFYLRSKLDCSSSVDVS
jgi:hypothetical protein